MRIVSVPSTGRKSGIIDIAGEPEEISWSREQAHCCSPRLSVLDVREVAVYVFPNAWRRKRDFRPRSVSGGLRSFFVAVAVAWKCSFVSTFQSIEYPPAFELAAASQLTARGETRDGENEEDCHSVRDHTEKEDWLNY